MGHNRQLIYLVLDAVVLSVCYEDSGRNIKIYRLQCSWEIDDLYENVLDYFGDDCE